MPPTRAMTMSDAEVVEALKRGDDDVFASLVDALTPALMRMARMYVRDRAVAEEVVQETWISVLRGIDGFEGRSALRTWIFRILINTAKTRGRREARSVPFSAAAPRDDPSLDPDRFFGPDHRVPGDWAFVPTEWPTPEEELLSGETHQVILDAIDDLPDSQRAVITMRDIEGLPSSEVASALEISEVNQRVLLHRARSKVRAALEAYFGAVHPNPEALP